MTRLLTWWRNQAGNPIPDWVQGRGAGEAGRVLHIISRGTVLRVEPGQMLILADDDEPVLAAPLPDKPASS